MKKFRGLRILLKYIVIIDRIFNNFNMFKVLLLLSKVLGQLFDSSILT